MAGYHGGYMRTMLSTVEVNSKDGAAASSNGAGVDMQGWDGVIFQAIVGTIGNGGTFDMRVVESANSNFSGAVNITGAALTQVPNTQPNTVYSIDVFRPTNRYVRVNATVGTNNVNYGVIAHRYRHVGRAPLTLPTNSQYVTVAAN